MTDTGLFPEPEHAKPLTDGPWAVGLAPDRLRYAIVGEDGDTLIVHGHGVGGTEIRDVMRHARLYIDDETVLQPSYTWAALLDHCPRHRMPRWLRVAVVAAVDRPRHLVFKVLWKLWWSRDPLRQWWRPGWLQWVQRRWRVFEDCMSCEWMDHYRHDPDAAYWTWDTGDGPDDANRGKPGYFPVTVVDLEG